METIYTEKHKLRDAKTELFGGKLVQPHERPSRAEYVIDRVRKVGLGPVSGPDDFGMEPIHAIHEDHFTEFLETAPARWKAEGFEGEAIPTTWVTRRMSNIRPNFIEGQLGYYALAGETSRAKAHGKPPMQARRWL
jgi:acetoin utilization deacetylase AcuC-like enzyme